MDTHIELDEPRYTISVVARLVNLHPQTLRNYEELELVVPRRSSGNFRMYTERDVQLLQKIVRMTNDLGVNLAGVAVILNLTERVEVLQSEVEALEDQLRAHGLEPCSTASVERNAPR